MKETATTLHSQPAGSEAEAMPPPALDLRGLSVRLGGRPVLDNVSVPLLPGEMVGLAGPNGSGKTTLLRAAAGLIPTESGSITVAGRDLEEMSRRERSRAIGYMPQGSSEHTFTALETVLMGRYPRLGRFSLEGRSDIEAAEHAMERVGTLEFSGRKLDTLSGGERQRVALARLLAQEADILLLDEPTAYLDPQHQLLAMELLRAEAAGGKAVAVVLHDLSLAARYCDRIVLLGTGGRVVADGDGWSVVSPENLRTVFGVDAAVEPEPLSGRPYVSLLGLHGSEHADAAAGARLHVHVICGAGSGRDLMHRVATAGHEVTAGVLGEGDADHETASRLAIRHIAAPPFSEITLEQDREHRSLVRSADVVVLCDMAVGPGNLRNLEAASEAGRLLIVRRPKRGIWDYTDGRATSAYDQLARRAEIVDRDAVLPAVSGAT